MKKIFFAILLIVIITIALFIKFENDKTKLNENKKLINQSIKDKGTISGVDYKLNCKFSDKVFDLTKRGYYVDTYNKPNSPYLYIITSGIRRTGGYTIEIVNIEIDDDLNVTIIVKEESPCDDCFVTQALTYPSTCLELNKEVKSIKVVDTEGNHFEKLD